MKDGMGWDDDFTSRAGIPQYPCLIDQKHITGELYEFINVPMAVWIDEKGRVVRPAEPAGVAEDIVRAMDPKTYQIPKASRPTRASGCDARTSTQSGLGRKGRPQ